MMEIDTEPSKPQPYRLHPISPIQKLSYRDDAVYNILKIHKEFLKLEPISPIFDSKTSVKYPQASEVKKTGELSSLKVKSCQYHILNRPKKPCMDCFI